MLLFILIGGIAGNDVWLISSLRTAQSFIYRSGTQLVIENTSDAWRICPQSLPTTQCYPYSLKTKQCTALLPDCRCYNWIVRETPQITARDHCVYLKLPLAAEKTVIQWELEPTYPVLAPGYVDFLQLLYGRLIDTKMSFDDYLSLMTPLVCAKAKEQQILEPAFDNCPYRLELDVAYYTPISTPSRKIHSVGPTVGVVLMCASIGMYALFFLKMRKHKNI
jgi:hypothetical protein